MASLAIRAFSMLLCAACARPGQGPVVLAPAAEGSAPAPRPPAPPAVDKLAACTAPWTLEDVQGGQGRVVLVCDGDPRRQDLEPGLMTRVIEPILEPARQRVCACAGRMPVPAFVDLVVTSVPDEGRATVAVDELDDELDRDLATAFAACIGTLSATVPRGHLDACGTGKAALKYPLRVDLVP